MGIKRYIWSSLWLAALGFLAIPGCGLPDYVSIDPPEKIETGLDTLIGFTTPADDTYINGYMIYYKIYRENSDYDDDVSEFDNADDELQPGSTLVKHLGFARVGKEESPVRTLPPASGGFLLSHSTIETTVPAVLSPRDVFIDFNVGNVADSNDREEPQVFVDDDGDNSSASLSLSSLNIFLTRGYYDPISRSAPLRYFVDDWYFEDSGGDHFDADLLIPVPSAQPGTSTSVWSGTPFVTLSDIPSDLIIGFVVYSTGVDVSGGAPTFVESIPVHIGKVVYSAIGATSR